MCPGLSSCSSTVTYENDMCFVTRAVPFPAMNDQRSRVAGYGTKFKVKTFEWSHLIQTVDVNKAILDAINFSAVKITMPNSRKDNLPW